eukprot:gene22966-24285_t
MPNSSIEPFRARGWLRQREARPPTPPTKSTTLGKTPPSSRNGFLFKLPVSVTFGSNNPTYDDDDATLSLFLPTYQFLTVNSISPICNDVNESAENYRLLLNNCLELEVNICVCIVLILVIFHVASLVALKLEFIGRSFFLNPFN